MRSVACLLLVCSAALAKVPIVTVLVDFEQPYSSTSLVALRQELKNLLKPAGVEVDLLLKNELPPSPEFSELVIFTMKGSCSMTPMPLPALVDERGPLAMAYSSDGVMLHFGEVECDRVRQCLDRVLGRGDSEKRQGKFGTALGIVIAHEMYHMIAKAKHHSRQGVTKESLSALDLLEGDLSLPRLAREALRRNLTP